MLKVRPEVDQRAVDQHLASLAVLVELLAGPAGGASVPWQATQLARSCVGTGGNDFPEPGDDIFVPLTANFLGIDLARLRKDVVKDSTDGGTPGLPGLLLGLLEGLL